MWFIIAVIAFFLLALAAVIDKFLLSKTRINPTAFAFYIAVLSGAVVSILILFEPDFFFPKDQLPVIILGGFTLFFGLYFMFLALAKSEVSKVNPLVVSFAPVFVFFFSFFLGLEPLSLQKIIGALLIVIGGYYLSQVGAGRVRIKFRIWLLILMAALLLGLANVYSKLTYDQLPFLNALIWLRWSSLAAALLFVILGNQWREISVKCPADNRKASPWTFFILGQLAGGLGVIAQQLAIKLGNVILVTALNGSQFFFVILLVWLLSRRSPGVLKESVGGKSLPAKLGWSTALFIGIVLILI
ncbi:MAG TPA: EamA family transporter [Patescibacteria group bacterium]|nr:EamA family transporter [Patescibacteria group bacterium]